MNRERCPTHPSEPREDCALCERAIAALEDREADGPEFTDRLPSGGTVSHCGFDFNYPAWGEW